MKLTPSITFIFSAFILGAALILGMSAEARGMIAAFLSGALVLLVVGLVAIGVLQHRERIAERDRVAAQREALQAHRDNIMMAALMRGTAPQQGYPMMALPPAAQWQSQPTDTSRWQVIGGDE